MHMAQQQDAGLGRNHSITSTASDVLMTDISPTMMRTGPPSLGSLPESLPGPALAGSLLGGHGYGRDPARTSALTWQPSEPAPLSRRKRPLQSEFGQQRSLQAFMRARGSGDTVNTSFAPMSMDRPVCTLAQLRRVCLQA